MHDFVRSDTNLGGFACGQRVSGRARPMLRRRDGWLPGCYVPRAPASPGTSVDSNRTRPTTAIASALLLGLFTFASSGPDLEARSSRIEREPGLTSAQKSDTDAAKRVRAAYTGMPLRFERAVGPAAANAEFIARGAGYAVDLARGEARLVIGGTPDGPRTAVTIRLLGASASANGQERRVLPGMTNYLIGNNPREWRTGVRSYAEVEYRGVYPGVDVVYYGNQRQLEFDFIVSPGANHRDIALAFEGSASLSIDRAGNLLVKTAVGTLVQHAPVIYQEESGTRRTVHGGYVLQARRARWFPCPLVRSKTAADHRPRINVFQLPRWLSRGACGGRRVRRAREHIRRRPHRRSEFSGDRLIRERPWARRLGRLRREAERSR